MLQFDIVLLKFTLQKTHQTMHMPAHGEFLVERLCQEGLNSGLIFGIDDFLRHAQTLEHSPAEILIVCGVDQHYSDVFLEAWSRVKKPYAYRILINSEPIYSPLAYEVHEYDNARLSHEKFIAQFMPDLILYTSPFDVRVSLQKYRNSFSALFYPMADPALFAGSVLPWVEKQQALLFLGKEQAWLESAAPKHWWSRSQQILYFLQQRQIRFEAYHEHFTFRQCYQAANQFRFQLQPRSGFLFHTARVLQAAAVQSIPVILLHREALTLWEEEASPWLIPNHNVLLGWDGEYEALLQQMADPELCQQIAANLPDLAQAVNTSQTIHDMVAQIQAHFRG